MDDISQVSSVNELMHAGRKGQKHGFHIFCGPNCYISAHRKKHKKNVDETETKEETPEEKRTRLLKSTNASELYKNRDLLTTAEIKERLERIDWEQKLSKKASESKKPVLDRIEKMVDGYKKVDNIFKTVKESSIGKMVWEELFGEEPTSKEFDLAKVYRNRNKLDTKTLLDATQRIQYEARIKEALDQANTKKTDSKPKKNETDSKPKKNETDKQNQSNKDTTSESASKLKTAYNFASDTVEKIKRNNSNQGKKKKNKNKVKHGEDLYDLISEIGEDTLIHVDEDADFETFIEHSGRKGMKWNQHVFCGPNCYKGHGEEGKKKSGKYTDENGQLNEKYKAKYFRGPRIEANTPESVKARYGDDPLGSWLTELSSQDNKYYLEELTKALENHDRKRVKALADKLERARVVDNEKRDEYNKVYNKLDDAISKGYIDDKGVLTETGRKHFVNDKGGLTEEGQMLFSDKHSSLTDIGMKALGYDKKAYAVEIYEDGEKHVAENDIVKLLDHPEDAIRYHYRLTPAQDSDADKRHVSEVSRRQKLSSKEATQELFEIRKQGYEADNIELWSNFEKEVKRYSFDAYDGCYVSDRAKKNVKAYLELKNKRNRSELTSRDYHAAKYLVYRECCGAALKDLGYPDTEENRGLVYDCLFY